MPKWLLLREEEVTSLMHWAALYLLIVHADQVESKLFLCITL